MQVLDHIGADPATAVMFEDSLKNINACKELGMGTGERVFRNSCTLRINRITSLAACPVEGVRQRC